MTFRSYCKGCESMTDHIEGAVVENPHVVPGTFQSRGFTVATAQSVQSKCSVCGTRKTVVRSNQ